MLYREAGQFKTTYGADQAIFPILQDRLIVWAFVVFLIVFPFMETTGDLKSLWILLLINAMAALGLNILTGYCGQVSLGTAGFMGCGAFAAYKLTTSVPELNILIVVLLSGIAAALIGILFGLPSLRIKGFYLAVATLAAQFFLTWAFIKIPWLYNYNSSGTITAPPRYVFGQQVAGPLEVPQRGVPKEVLEGLQRDMVMAQYWICLALVVVFAVIAKNLVRGRLGRAWMAIRDMDIAAELIGIRPLRTKLLAFAISSYFCGVAGSMLFFFYLGSLEGGEAFSINDSFLYLFMVIIGGLGAISGSFLGAAFITLLPILLIRMPPAFGIPISVETVTHLQFMIFGGLIVFFLIVEPLGLARLWGIVKEKLRQWPFPY